MSTEQGVSSVITTAVQRLYEAFPYPRYPLLGKPLWQDGYLTSSKFAAKLFEDLTGQESAINTARGQYVRHGRTILVAGAGEVLPYIIRKNEPSAHRLLCVDLSRRSLQRARFRLLTDLRPTDFIRADINHFLAQQGAVTGPFDHIDVYGVLHHLADPAETLRALTTNLSGNGTLRLMVYNTAARHWIHELQAVLRLLKLDLYRKDDLQRAKTLFEKLAHYSPHLADKFSCLGPGTLQNDARFIDTFFHVREAKIPLRRWFEMFSACGLKPYALVDRYGELDDTANPLWTPPTWEMLEERSTSGAFENNLELFLYKERTFTPKTKQYSYERKPDVTDIWTHYLKSPPRNWFSFPETAHLSPLLKYKLWHKHFNATFKTSDATLESILPRLSSGALQRLARIGAILPSQIADQTLRNKAAQPMTANAHPGEDIRHDKANFEKNSISDEISTILHAKNVWDERRFALIMKRLNRSQFP